MDEPGEQPAFASKTTILTAIAKAMGQVTKVTKEGRNKHDGYSFASIDDFLALVNPICSDNGLIVLMQELEREDFERQSKNGTSSWVRMSFGLTLVHVSGESLPEIKRTVEVVRSGAQTYGSAQSYVLKQFWRALLLIPTGDTDDADHAPRDDGRVVSEREKNKRAKFDADVQAAVEKIASLSLKKGATLDELREAFLAIPNSIRSDPRVIDAKDDAKAVLEKAQEDDSKKDEASEKKDPEKEPEKKGEPEKGTSVDDDEIPY